MGRWEPGSRSRLEQAAMALYGERGYEDTTVVQIAERAGLTERTFFRHFGDKREVLFSGAAALQDLLVSAVADAPPSATPLEAVTEALEAVGPMFEERREFAPKRQTIIMSSVELRERELIKLASLSVALAEALRSRGVADPIAGLTGEVAIAVFKVAFDRWVEEDNEQNLTQHVREMIDQLKVVIS